MSWFDAVDPGKSFDSRFIGLFYEDLIRHWFQKRWKYMELGRPSLYDENGKYLHRTYDYYLQIGSEEYIVEAKLWTSYSNGKYAKLNESIAPELRDEGVWHTFAFFLNFPLEKFVVKVNQQIREPKHKALVWWDYDRDKKDSILDKLGVTKIWSIRDAFEDLQKTSEYPDYVEKASTLLHERKRRVDRMFENLLPAKQTSNIAANYYSGGPDMQPDAASRSRAKS